MVLYTIGIFIINQTSKVNSLNVSLQDKDPSYLIEWVLNFKCNYILDFPFKFFNKNEKMFSIDGLELSTKSQMEGYYSCIRIEMKNFSIYIGESLEETRKDSAFIMYSKNINEEERNKIRNCISFILGIPLIYLGYTSFLKDGTIQGLKAISAYDYNGAFSIPSLPTSLLSKDGSNFISSEIFSQKVNKLYVSYNKYNFQHLFWLYFHARTSNIQVSAAQYGASIEFLKNKYMKENELAINTKLFNNKEEWNNFKQKLIDETSHLSLDNEAQNVLKNKINSLNSLPFNIKLNSFFESFDTKLSNLEKKAWQQRNDSAHGNMIKDNDYLNLIKEVNILMCLFNRLLLLTTNCSKDYINYNVLGHPSVLCKEGHVIKEE